MRKRLGIGKFAQLCGLSVSALRFYDTAGLLAPAEIDGQTGYRLYHEDQLGDAVLVKDLRRLEMPLGAIAGFLVAGGAERRRLLTDHVEALSARTRRIEATARRVLGQINQEDDTMTTMTVEGADLCQALDQVLPAAGRDPERPVLMGVVIEAREGSLRLVATDSYRLALRDLVPLAGSEAAFQVLVPAATLARVRPQLDGAAQLQVGVEGSKLRISGGAEGSDIEVLLFPAQYPDYEALMASDPSASALTVERNGLIGALRAGDGEVVRLTLGPAGLRVGSDPGVELGGDYPGPEMSLGLNRSFATQAIEAALGPDLRLEVLSPLKPVVFRSATDSSFICLLMPIRLD